jgi:PRC-barrel domain
MLKKLMITTAISGLMIATAMAEGTPPAGSPSGTPQSTTQTEPAMPSGTPKAAAPAPTSPTAQFINSQKPDQLLASKFKGTDVLGPDNEKIGDVTDILFDKGGKIDAFVVGVGGFLGMGAKEVAMAPSAFQVVPGDKAKNEDDKLKVSMTKDQLKQAANFERYNPPRATTGMAPGATRPAPAPAPSPAR